MSRHGSGCEHKGHSKKINVKTSAAHRTKSEMKSVKAMVQSHIKAKGAASLLEKLTGKIYNKASRPPN
jgi:ribosomal protein L31E